jgi:hypothetical protein
MAIDSVTKRASRTFRLSPARGARVPALLLALLQASPAWPSATFVQTATNSVNTNSVLTVNLGSAPNAGDALVLWSSVTGSNVISSISGGGVTWANGTNVGAGSGNPEIWYGLNSSGVGTAITITYSGSDDMAAVVAEFSGVAASGALDAASASHCGSATPATLPSITTTNADDLLLAVYGVSNASTIYGVTSPQTSRYWVDFSTQSGATNNELAASYLGVASAATYTGFSRALNPSQAYCNGVIALKASPTTSSFVQATSVASSGAGAISAPAITNTVGDFIVAACRQGSDTTSISSVSDSLGNTYHLVANAGQSCSGSREVAIYYAANIKGGSNTVSCNFASSLGTAEDLVVMEFSKVGDLSPSEGNVTSFNNAGTAAGLASGTLNTAYPRDVLVYAVNLNAAPTFVPDSGYTVPTNGSAGDLGVEYKIVTAAAAQSAVMHWAGGACAAGIFTAFKDYFSGGQVFSPHD